VGREEGGLPRMIEFFCDVGRESHEGCPALERSERSLLISGNTRRLDFWVWIRYGNNPITVGMHKWCAVIRKSGSA